MMRLSDYDAYGFDIDHTIAKYNIPYLFDKSYQTLADYMVDVKGYDSYLLEPFDKDFCMRGIIFDTKKGNFLKLSENGTIFRATHGTKFLTEDEIKAEYGPRKHWDKFEDMINTVNNLGDDYRIYENFFDIPGTLLCARLVDLADKQGKGKTRTYNFLEDVRGAYEDAFNPKQFEADKGGYFPQFKKETSKFLEPCSTDVKDWLKRLRKNKKKVFIITSSFVDYASCVMEYVLGTEWKEYFDYFFFLARKPGFFSKSNYFLRLDGTAEREPAMELKPGEFYSQGNVEQLMKTLASSLEKEEPRVLYFGDSLRSDVFPAKRYSSWDTVMILEEMAAEVGTLYDEPQASESTENNDDRADCPSPRKKIRLMGPSQLEKEYLTSQKWGSLFTDDSSPQKEGSDLAYMNTLWGYIIRKYTDVAIPQLEAITDYPLSHKLTMFNHEEQRTWGFHPHVPEALKDPNALKSIEGLKDTAALKAPEALKDPHTPVNDIKNSDAKPHEDEAVPSTS